MVTRRNAAESGDKEQSSTEQAMTRDPVGKALDLLTWAVDSGPTSWGVREAAKAVDMQPTTVGRCLSLLRRKGFVDVDGHGRYRLSPEFIRLARVASSRFSIEDDAKPTLRNLVTAANGVAHLVRYDRHRNEVCDLAHVTRDFLALEESPPFEISINVNRWRPVTSLISGIVVLAFLPEAQSSQLQRTVRIIDRGPVASRAELRAAVATTRQRGLAIMPSFPNENWATLAAPIFGVDDDVLFGVLILVAPRGGPNDLDKMSRLLLESVNQISGLIAPRTRRPERASKKASGRERSEARSS